MKNFIKILLTCGVLIVLFSSETYATERWETKSPVAACDFPSPVSKGQMIAFFHHPQFVKKISREFCG